MGKQLLWLSHHKSSRVFLLLGILKFREINLARSKLQRENPTHINKTENGVDFSLVVIPFTLFRILSSRPAVGDSRFLADARLCFDGPNFRSRRQHAFTPHRIRFPPFPTFFRLYLFSFLAISAHFLKFLVEWDVMKIKRSLLLQLEQELQPIYDFLVQLSWVPMTCWIFTQDLEELAHSHKRMLLTTFDDF